MVAVLKVKGMTERELAILEKGAIECRDVTSLLGSYVEGDLSATLHERIADHIAESEVCREGEAGYREVMVLARTLPPVRMDADVNRRLRLALNKKLGLSLSVE